MFLSSSPFRLQAQSSSRTIIELENNLFKKASHRTLGLTGVYLMECCLQIRECSAVLSTVSQEARCDVWEITARHFKA